MPFSGSVSPEHTVLGSVPFPERLSPGCSPPCSSNPKGTRNTSRCWPVCCNPAVRRLRSTGTPRSPDRILREIQWIILKIGNSDIFLNSYESACLAHCCRRPSAMGWVYWLPRWCNNRTRPTAAFQIAAHQTSWWLNSSSRSRSTDWLISNDTLDVLSGGKYKLHTGFETTEPQRSTWQTKLRAGVFLKPWRNNFVFVCTFGIQLRSESCDIFKSDFGKTMQMFTGSGGLGSFTRNYFWLVRLVVDLENLDLWMLIVWKLLKFPSHRSLW